jgi:hypothetical protein
MIKIVAGPKGLRGWVLSGPLPAIEVYDFTMQDIGRDTPAYSTDFEHDYSVFYYHEGKEYIIPEHLLPPPTLVPRCEAVKQFRKIYGLDPLDEIPI